MPLDVVLPTGAPAAPAVTHSVSMRARWIVALVVFALAFAFLGSRGLWDPDEGRYTNVAANMVSSGDWIMPHRNHEIGHWTKPPLTYWAIAASFSVFGMNTWSARLPVALAYLFATWCVMRIARRVAPGREVFAALVFATMFAPALASQLVTTDFLLTALETLALWAYTELRWGDGQLHWDVLMWAAFALAFLTKGPPGLLPLLAIVAMELLAPSRRRAFHPFALLVFVVVALWWFVVVVSRNPALLHYFLGREVADRVATNEFSRHGEWYGWLVVYVPTLLVGSLPWTLEWLGFLRRVPSHVMSWRTREGRRVDSKTFLLVAWLVLPLAVFCIARSRLPLYVLPLFAPIALMIAASNHEASVVPARAGTHTHLAWRRLLLWVPLLLGIRFAGGMIDSPQDSRALAEAIRARAGGPVHEVVFVDQVPRYGLRVHLNAEVEDITLAAFPRANASTINPRFDEDALSELIDDRGDPRDLWICTTAHWPEVRRFMQAHGQRAEAIGTPYRNSVIFRVRPG